MVSELEKALINVTRRGLTVEFYANEGHDALFVTITRKPESDRGRTSISFGIPVKVMEQSVADHLVGEIMRSSEIMK